MTPLTPNRLGPVTITLPAEPTLSRIVRLAASGMASMAQFSVDEIEDIRIAVSEVLIALIEHGESGDVELRLSVDNGKFRIDGSTAVSEFNLDHPDLALCRTVLDGVGATHGIELSPEGRASIWAMVSSSTTGE